MRSSPITGAARETNHERLASSLGSSRSRDSLRPICAEPIDDEFLRIALSPGTKCRAVREFVYAHHELHRVRRRLVDDFDEPVVHVERHPAWRPFGCVPVKLARIDAHL